MTVSSRYSDHQGASMPAPVGKPRPETPDDPSRHSCGLVLIGDGDLAGAPPIAYVPHGWSHHLGEHLSWSCPRGEGIFDDCDRTCLVPMDKTCLKHGNGPRT
jgi:hypothetical protein